MPQQDGIVLPPQEKTVGTDITGELKTLLGENLEKDLFIMDEEVGLNNSSHVPKFLTAFTNITINDVKFIPDMQAFCRDEGTLESSVKKLEEMVTGHLDKVELSEELDLCVDLMSNFIKGTSIAITTLMHKILYEKLGVLRAKWINNLTFVGFVTCDLNFSFNSNCLNVEYVLNGVKLNFIEKCHQGTNAGEDVSSSLSIGEGLHKLTIKTSFKKDNDSYTHNIKSCSLNDNGDKDNKALDRFASAVCSLANEKTLANLLDHRMIGTVNCAPENNENNEYDENDVKYKERSMCQRVISFSVKHVALDSAVYLSWALLSTYAKVGVVAGAAAITGPVGIIVAASICFLCSACLLYSVSRRNLAEKNKIKNKKEEEKENLENNYQNILPIHDSGDLTLEQGNNAKYPVV